MNKKKILKKLVVFKNAVRGLLAIGLLFVILGGVERKHKEQYNEEFVQLDESKFTQTKGMNQNGFRFYKLMVKTMQSQQF